MGYDAGKVEPVSASEASAEAQRIVALMREVNSAETVEQWLRSPLGALGGASPRELIAAGEAERVLALVLDLRRGISGISS